MKRIANGLITEISTVVSPAVHRGTDSTGPVQRQSVKTIKSVVNHLSLYDMHVMRKRGS